MAPNWILAGFTAVFLAVYGWERFLELLNLRHTASRRESPPEWVRPILDEAAYRRAVDYALARGRLGLASATLAAALTLGMLWTGFLGLLESLALRVPLGGAPAAMPLRGVIVLVSLGLIYGLSSLPFSLYARFGIEERFGFNRMSLKLFLLDRLKGLLLSVLLVLPPLFGLLWFIGLGVRFWWLYAFLLAACFQLLLAVLAPAVIAPLFNRFTPLPEGSLREKIFALAHRLSFRTSGIYVVDSSRRSGHSNAYFTGLGRAKRIVLFDTLLESLGEESVVAVLAHEIGHEQHHHLRQGLAFSLAGLLLVFFGANLLLQAPPVFRAFGFAGPSPYALLTLLGLLSGPLAALLDPLVSAWSRRNEYQADRLAVRAVGRPDDLREALIRLSRGNLSNPVPHPLYSFVRYSHPTLPERLRALQDSRISGSGPPPGHSSPA